VSHSPAPTVDLEACLLVKVAVFRLLVERVHRHGLVLEAVGLADEVPVLDEVALDVAVAKRLDDMRPARELPAVIDSEPCLVLLIVGTREIEACEPIEGGIELVQ